jgi:hypothetical protein
LGAHTDAQLRFIPKVFLNVSVRAELLRTRWQLMPRATLSYIPNQQWQLSLVAGRYSQTPNYDQLAQSNYCLGQSTADHLILSLQYKGTSNMLRIEPYYKRYRHLPWMQQDQWQPDGYGTSRGVDVFLEDHSLARNLITTLSYSYNDSRRLYHDYTEERTPDFASRHNLRLTVKFSIGKLIFGLAESYASGRHFTNGTTPYYNSIDANITYLVSPKVIVYTSLNNIFGRTNIFRYDAAGSPVTASRDLFFYIGIFVSLKNNKAYDISNF